MYNCTIRFEKLENYYITNAFIAVENSLCWYREKSNVPQIEFHISQQLNFYSRSYIVTSRCGKYHKQARIVHLTDQLDRRRVDFFFCHHLFVPVSPPHLLSAELPRGLLKAYVYTYSGCVATASTMHPLDWVNSIYILVEGYTNIFILVGYALYAYNYLVLVVYFRLWNNCATFAYNWKLVESHYESLISLFIILLLDVYTLNEFLYYIY